MDYIYELLRWISGYLKLTNQESYDELYYKLLREKDFDEALRLAQKHRHLDLDLYHKCRWRSRVITVQSVSLLDKIEDKLWVIHECVRTVPISYEACRTLIDYGLKLANLRFLYQLGVDSPSSQPGDTDLSDDAIEGLIDFDNLNDQQKELCRFRQKLLCYQQSLSAYESILGDYRDIQQHFDHVFYHDFRTKSPLKNCIHYANEGNAHAVSTLLDFHAEDLSSHILPILSNFPETISPFKYRNLLPCLREEDVVYEWRTGKSECESFDWSDRDTSSKIKAMMKEDAEQFEREFYDLNPQLEKYLKPLTSDILTEWFVERALEMEARTLLITNALQLLDLATELGIKSLERTQIRLRRFSEIIYNYGADDNIHLSYSELNRMSENDRLILLTSDFYKIKTRIKLMAFVLALCDNVNERFCIKILDCLRDLRTRDEDVQLEYCKANQF